MPQPRRSSIRLSPRRHDAGAALMIQFRPKDGGTAGNRRLQPVDLLKAFLLPMICFTVVFVAKEQRGIRWFKPADVLAAQPTESTGKATPSFANRTAPASPLENEFERTSVRLTHIEDLPDDKVITRPASLAREVRVAEEEAPLETPSAAQPAEPSLRAALDLGDQPRRVWHR